MNRYFKNFIPYLVFPFLMSVSIYLYFMFDVPRKYIYIKYLFAVIFFTLIVHLLEKILPLYREDWKKKDGEEKNDIGHMVFGYMLGEHAANSINYFLTPMLLMTFIPERQTSFWPGNLPLIVQLGIVYLVVDFGRYWEHRAMHEVRFFWKIHVIHHSSEKLSPIKHFRSSFIEKLISVPAKFALILFLGAPYLLIVAYAIPSTFRSILAHSNLDQKLGPLEYIIHGPATHRFHHSTVKKECNSNYTHALVFWDIIFRTYTCPVGKEGPEKIGSPYGVIPKNFLAQYFLPFTKIKKSRSHTEIS